MTKRLSGKRAWFLTMGFAATVLVFAVWHNGLVVGHAMQKNFLTSSGPATSHIIVGDVNADGILNALDITKLERIIAHLDSTTSGADANQDGNVNALDITKIERDVVGLDVSNAWVKTGGPIGGLGYDVRMRPDDPNQMYVTDSWSGLNLSKDGGQTWTSSNNGITSRTGMSGDAIPVFSVTVSPQNPNILWAGTQGVRGIFKSTDGGLNWIKKDNGVVEDNGLSLRGLAVDPNNINVVYAAGEISSSLWRPEGQLNGIGGFDLVKGVVYKTTDGGDNWTAIWRGDNLARYVWIDPGNSNKLYVSTGLFDRDASNETPGNLAGVGILKSTNGGQTWQTFNGTNGLNNLYVTSLFMNPANPDILLAGTGVAGPVGQNTNLGAYLSDNGGQSWQYVLPCTTPISAVEFSTSNASIAYAGGPEGVWRSTDTGQTWQKMTTGNFWGAPGTRAGFPIDFQVDPRNPNRIFANNYGGGNFMSEDGGSSWVVASQGYTGAYLHVVAVNPQNKNNVFVIGRTGPFRTYNAGSAWEGLTREPASLGEWYSIAIDPANPNNIIEADEYQGLIFRSTDQGANWTQVFRNTSVDVNNPLTRGGFKALAFSTNSTSVVWGGMEIERNQVDQNLAINNGTPFFGVYRSGDGGLTWHDANDANTAHENINAIAADPGNPGIAYAATLQHGIFKTYDGGANWTAVNQGLGGTSDVRSIAIDPHNSQVVFAGLENGAIYISTDGGNHWQLSGNGMDPNACIRAIVFDPTNSQDIFAADIRTGVYRSQDGGQLWVHINDGLRTRTVVSMAISSDGSFLYAATQGEGVFRMTLK